MRRIIFGVRDQALESFLSVWLAPTTGAALRSFEDEARRGDGPMSAHPGHYSLHEFGTFDDVSGSFEIHPVPRMLCYASDFKEVLK